MACSGDEHAVLNDLGLIRDLDGMAIEDTDPPKTERMLCSVLINARRVPYAVSCYGRRPEWYLCMMCGQEKRDERSSVELRKSVRGRRGK